MFGNPEITPGGRALKFYATIRLEVRRAEQLKQGTDIVGNRTKIKVVKNKVAPPFKIAEVDVMYGLGISQEGELLDMAVEKTLLIKAVLGILIKKIGLVKDGKTLKSIWLIILK